MFHESRGPERKCHGVLFLGNNFSLTIPLSSVLPRNIKPKTGCGEQNARKQYIIEVRNHSNWGMKTSFRILQNSHFVTKLPLPTFKNAYSIFFLFSLSPLTKEGNSNPAVPSPSHLIDEEKINFCAVMQPNLDWLPNA